MPINIRYEPAAQAIADIAFRGGLGQFEQRQDQFGFDVSRFQQGLSEQQRQFNVGTQLDLLRLREAQRAQQLQAALALEQQARDQFGRERMAGFQAQQQRAGRLEELQMQGQLQGQLAGQQQMGRIQLQQNEAAFRQREAEFNALVRARQAGQIRNDQQWADAVGQLNQRYGHLDLPALGANIPAPPDPMEQIQQQVDAMNQNIFGGNPVAFMQPNGTIDFLPWQNTPDGQRQLHEHKMEIERAKQEQAQREAQQKAQIEQQEAQQKIADQWRERVRSLEDQRRKFIEAEIKNRSQQEEKSISAGLQRPGTQSSVETLRNEAEQRWNTVWGDELQRSQQALQQSRQQNRQAQQPPAQSQPFQGQGVPEALTPPTQGGTVEQQVTYQQITSQLLPPELRAIEARFPIHSAFSKNDLPIVNKMLVQSRRFGARAEDMTFKLTSAYEALSRGNMEDARMLFARRLLPNVSSEQEIFKLPPGTLYYDTRTNKIFRND